MKLLSVALLVCGFTSICGLVMLVMADRHLGVPVPYAVAFAVAFLNATAALATALPGRIVVPTMVSAKACAPSVAVQGRSTVGSSGAPIDEAIVWFESDRSARTEEAA